MANVGNQTGGLPLDEYTRATPPGWRPGLDWYPLRLYLDKLKIWYRIQEYEEAEIGPIIAGRLKGGALKLALTLRVPTPLAQADNINNGWFVGDEALIRPAVQEERDPGTGNLIQPALPSGVQTLLRLLENRYGLDHQDKVTSSLDAFFDFRRERLSLQEYLNEFEVRYDDAETRAGLRMNEVARSHLLLRWSGISRDKQDDIRLHVNGDMNRYSDIVQLLHRLSRKSDREQHHHGIHYGDEHKESWSEDNEWHDDYWYGDDMFYDDDDEEYWQDYEVTEGYDGTDEDWYWPEVPTDDESYWGKGKGKGKGKSGGKGFDKDDLGCATCGSKFHRLGDCPLTKMTW